MRALLIGLAALIGGLALGWWMRGALETPAERVTSKSTSVARVPNDDKPPVELAEVSSDDAKSKIDDRPSNTSTPERVQEGLISAALREYALTELRGGWAELRKDTMPEPTLARGFETFDERMRALPRAIGRELAQRQSLDDTLAGDDLLAIVRMLDERNANAPIELARDRERFEKLFSCTGGPAIEGPAAVHEPSERWVDGTRIVFPSGVFSLSKVVSHLASGRPAPRCVTIQGAGMDATLFVGATLESRSGFELLRVADATLYSGAEIVDLGDGAHAITLERVRCIGFDTGAGGSDAFYAGTGAALRLLDCRIEGGYGRSPAFGRLFDLRTPAALIRLERCELRRLRVDPARLVGRAVVFLDCRFSELLDDAGSLSASETASLFERCRFTDAPPEFDAGAPRDLNELFPDWQQRVVR